MMLSHCNFSLLCFLQTCFPFYFFLKYSTLSLKHSSKNFLSSYSSSSSIAMSTRLEPFVPYPCVVLIISTSVLLTISSMICFFKFHCINDCLSIMIRGRKSYLVHIILKLIDDCPLQIFDLTFQSFYLLHETNMEGYQ